MLRNLEPPAVDHFRRTVEVLDLVGVSEIEPITASVRGGAENNPGPGRAFCFQISLGVPITRTVPEKMISDPSGYSVIFIDRLRGLLNVEHYKNNGVLTTIIEVRSAAEVYLAAIEHALLSRLDHAAYLGRELARAEHALSSGKPTFRTPHPNNVLRRVPAT